MEGGGKVGSKRGLATTWSQQALPVAYAKSTPSADWEPFARLVLRAAYDATLAVAALKALIKQSTREFLTRTLELEQELDHMRARVRAAEAHADAGREL